MMWVYINTHSTYELKGGGGRNPLLE